MDKMTERKVDERKQERGEFCQSNLLCMKICVAFLKLDDFDGTFMPHRFIGKNVNKGGILLQYWGKHSTHGMLLQFR